MQPDQQCGQAAEPGTRGNEVQPLDATVEQRLVAGAGVAQRDIDEHRREDADDGDEQADPPRTPAHDQRAEERHAHRHAAQRHGVAQ